MGTKETILKYGKKFASGAKNAHGALVQHYGKPSGPAKSGKKAVKKTTKRGGTQTIKIVHIHQVQASSPKRKKKRVENDDDDFFTSRGF